MAGAYLVLSDGTVYEGRAMGAAGESTGELVFTTGMTGYLETLTDPSYAGQIVVQTFPLIGNYGVISPDFEGASLLSGYVVRELCAAPSNFRSEYELDRYLKERGIPGICGVDTRSIARHLRSEGVMNARICSDLPTDMASLAAWRPERLVERSSGKEIREFPAEGEERFHAAVMDYGAKGSIVECLRRRGCRVTVFPFDTPAEAVLARSPDGILLSNGPGDPRDAAFSVEQLRRLIGKKPVFGICLGHQLAALALGGETVKLKFGHRGANQPVKALGGSRTFITAQNHGYAVVAESLAAVGRESFVNANDGSCEGMEYPALRCFTVQFHPEARSGPRDTEFLFDRFLAMMEEARHAQG